MEVEMEKEGSGFGGCEVGGGGGRRWSWWSCIGVVMKEAEVEDRDGRRNGDGRGGEGMGDGRP